MPDPRMAAEALLPLTTAARLLQREALSVCRGQFGQALTFTLVRVTAGLADVGGGE